MKHILFLTEVPNQFMLVSLLNLSVYCLVYYSLIIIIINSFTEYKIYCSLRNTYDILTDAALFFPFVLLFITTIIFLSPVIF